MYLNRQIAGGCALIGGELLLSVTTRTNAGDAAVSGVNATSKLRQKRVQFAGVTQENQGWELLVPAAWE